MQMTDKQKEFWRECVTGYHRWCVTYGATRSGKTYLQYYFIPKKVRELINKSGLAVILGNTHSTIERNILEPMRDIWGESLVGNIRTNKVVMFGQLFHIVGAEKISGVSKIQGQAIKLCIGDEVATWNEEVFSMLKSRLDKDYSVFYGTCNPDHPKHWFKEFLDKAKEEDSGIDVFAQHYTLDDNDYLPESFKNSLKAEYAGTVYYQRYILGLWVRAEGVIYSKFSADPSKFYVPYEDVINKFAIQEINIGVDFFKPSSVTKLGYKFTI
jgi:PBSX family phage terminase large subunit